MNICYFKLRIDTTCYLVNINIGGNFFSCFNRCGVCSVLWLTFVQEELRINLPIYVRWLNRFYFTYNVMTFYDYAISEFYFYFSSDDYAGHLSFTIDNSRLLALVYLSLISPRTSLPRILRRVQMHLRNSLRCLTLPALRLFVCLSFSLLSLGTFGGTEAGFCLLL